VTDDDRAPVYGRRAVMDDRGGERRRVKGEMEEGPPSPLVLSSPFSPLVYGLMVSACRSWQSRPRPAEVADEIWFSRLHCSGSRSDLVDHVATRCHRVRDHCHRNAIHDLLVTTHDQRLRIDGSFARVLIWWKSRCTVGPT